MEGSLSHVLVILALEGFDIRLIVSALESFLVRDTKEVKKELDAPKHCREGTSGYPNPKSLKAATGGFSVEMSGSMDVSAITPALDESFYHSACIMENRRPVGTLSESLSDQGSEGSVSSAHPSMNFFE